MYYPFVEYCNVMIERGAAVWTISISDDSNSMSPMIDNMIISAL